VTVPFIQTLPRESRHVEFHRVVEPVDGVVHPADLGDKAVIVGHQRCHGSTQHGLDDVAQMNDLAFCTGERDRWRAEAASSTYRDVAGCWVSPVRAEIESGAKPTNPAGR